MSEHPIIMSAESVRAILNNAKTQTRRVTVQPPPPDCGKILVGEYHPTKIDKHGEAYPGKPIFGACSEDGKWGVKCPYGKPGDHLWVRETWWQPPADEIFPVQYDADTDDASRQNAKRDLLPLGWQRRPSIYMPRWASRITLEITDIRVERLQDITEDDAIAEGVKPHWKDEARDIFAELWDSLNAKRGYGWDTNPLVWVVEYRRMKP